VTAKTHHSLLILTHYPKYSTGALPEDLLPLITCPVSILWGERDPWEPVALGRSTFAAFPCVREFVVLPEGGHCPMDQIPDQVNENVLRFVRSLEGGESQGQQPMQLFGAAGQ
jgi:pimeloyl-ACP methyl ester carboxylesterase